MAGAGGGRWGWGMGSLRPLDIPLTGLLAPLGIMAGSVRYWPQGKFKAKAAFPLSNILAGGKCSPPKVTWGLRLGHRGRIQKSWWE